MANLDSLRAIKDEHLLRLMALPNVNGVGIGKRRIGGVETDEFVVGVTVTTKVSTEQLRPDERIPESLISVHGGTEITVPTDVLEVGELRPGPGEHKAKGGEFQVRVRPVHPGYSIAGANNSAGTLGCFLVKDGSGYSLSNLHVMQAQPTNPVRQAVLQPGPLDGGVAADRVGDTAYYVPFKLGPNTENYMDTSTSTIDSYAMVDPAIPTIGNLKGFYQQLVVGWHFRKIGRTSGLTEGHLLYWDYGCDLDYQGAAKVHFAHQVLIQNLTFGTAISGGDSGALWVTDDNCAAALNFAGNQQGGSYSVATPIAWILQAYGANIWGGRDRESETFGVKSGLTPADAHYSDEVIAQILRKISQRPAEAIG